MDNQQHTRGLVAIERSRAGQGRVPAIPPRALLWIAIILAVWAIIYWKKTQGEIESARNRLLARQRAVASELAPRFDTLRDLIEKWTIENSAAWPGDIVTEQAKTSVFRSKPDVYVRLGTKDAGDAKSIRAAAVGSLRDGFSACLFKTGAADPMSGPECKLNHDCPSGQHCNELNHCAVPAQPFNLRVAYRAMRVLSGDFVKSVREADDDMKMRLAERDFESAVKDDIPLAIELATRAQYFVVVLDEPVVGAPAAQPTPDAGADAPDLLGTQHFVRVAIYDIAAKSLLMRARVQAVPTNGVPTTDAKIALAVRRQTASCSAALQVRRLLGDDDAI